MSLLPVFMFLCVLSWTGANGSCPGDYQSVSYTLRSKVVEACFLVSTDYVRWTDGGDVCGRRNNGSLAEFPSSRKLQAFQNFLSTMPDTTKDELWDAEHAWIGGAVLDGSVWRWHSSGEKLDSSISEELPINDFYGLTINVHSKELVPFKLQSLSLSPGHQTIHSYVCETDPRETEQTGSSVPQTVARDSSECQAELKRTQEELEEVQRQANCGCCSNLTRCKTELGQLRDKAFEVGLEQQRLIGDKDKRISELEAEARMKEERISGLERELGEEKRLNDVKIFKISALERELGDERRLRGTKEALRKDLDEAEKERDALKRQLEERREEQPKKCPSGFVSVGHSCYAVFDKESDERPWDAAQAFCKAQAAGGRLAELETKEEITRLKDHLKGNGYECGLFASRYWIGGEEVGDTNTFAWASTGQRIGDSDWYPGRPNHSGSGDAIYFNCWNNWRWFDWKKTNSRRFICEAPPTAV